MLRPSNDLLEVYLCMEPIDFRKRIPGLSVWIESELGNGVVVRVSNEADGEFVAGLLRGLDGAC